MRYVGTIWAVVLLAVGAAVFVLLREQSAPEDVPEVAESTAPAVGTAAEPEAEAEAEMPPPRAPLEPAAPVVPLRTTPTETPRPDIAEAWAALDWLKSKLKVRHSINEELLSGLHEVLVYCRGDGWSPSDAERDRYVRAAAKVFLKAFELVKLRAGTERNLRDDVNIVAAKALGETGDAKTSKALVSSIEKRLMKARYDVPVLVWEAAFHALARIGEPKAFEWMIEEFVHTKSSPARYVDQLTAAHEAMVRFDDPPGKLRYELVKELVKTYTGVEARAWQREASAERFWNRIRVGVLTALQNYCRNPTGVDGRALATMAEFSEWFRVHKDRRRAPWTD